MNLPLLAATAAQCELNGRPIDCAELADKAKPFIALGLWIMFFVFVVAALIFAFWLWMLIHVLQHKSPDRDTWLIVLIVSFVTGFGLVGALVYFFAEKKKAEQATPAKPRR